MTERHATPSRLWIKVDALIHRNPKAAKLTDAQFRAYVTSLCEAKLTQSEGEWPDEEHYRFAVGPKVARHLPVLLEAGLLERAADGWISVHDWGDWQPRDPTAAERSRRYRDKKRAERNGSDVTRDATGHHTDRVDRLERVDAEAVATGGLTAVATPGACPGCGQMPNPGEPTTVDARRREWHSECHKRSAA